MTTATNLLLRLYYSTEVYENKRYSPMGQQFDLIVDTGRPQAQCALRGTEGVITAYI